MNARSSAPAAPAGVATPAGSTTPSRPRPAPPARYRNFIGGKWTDGAGRPGQPNVNPADTRIALGEAPSSPVSDVAAAAAAARAAFPAWRDTP
ncbi:MAG: hypothetical protein ACREOU_11325, partial [Candidatus Eiseniibacteriota bacterium]